MDRDTRLGLIAQSILEGTPVDWPSLESSTDPDEQVVLRQLRVLQQVAALHRELSGDTATVSETLDVERTQAPRMWGHLQLIEQVGKGSFGEVYRAWDTHLDREVALKILRAGPAADDPSASLSDPGRVVNEGRLLARVRHPHVITVYGAEPREGTVGIWMEFIRGTTLHRLIEQQGRLSAREAIAIGSDLCRALSAVHGSGLLHRDISARNVMREEGGRVVLMDFGAGQDDGVPRESGSSITGTPLYMAPELFEGRPADARTDIYALGTLLFYLVTGRYPVTGRSVHEIRGAHRRGERVWLRDLRADVPGPFVRVVEQALNPDASQRFQSAGEMDAALSGLEAPEVAPAQETGPRRWMAAAVIAAAALGAGVGVPLLSRDTVKQATDRPATAAAPAGLTTRKISPPPGASPISNPSDDGRFMAGMMNDTGDAAIIDLHAGTVRALGLSQVESADGYASLGALSPDGSTAAVDWHDERGGTLYIVPTNGAPPRKILEPPADTWPHQWSRDGRMILGVITRPGQPNVIGLIAASDGAIRQIREIGAVIPRDMSLSPDGRYIAYEVPGPTNPNDRDIVILDAHTGNQWPLETSASDDTSPLWSPDGRVLLFLSDRNRTQSLWAAPVQDGRLQAAPSLVKDNIGRVILRGFTASGALHFNLSSGFAEVFLADISGTSPPRPQPLSPRRAVSNFYPAWSPDGRFVAYSSEQSDVGGTRVQRDLWIYDSATGTEVAVPIGEGIGRPLGWSRDSREVLVGGPQPSRLTAVDRASGRARVVTNETEGRGAWGPAGVVFQRRSEIVIVEPASGRTLRVVGPAKDAAVSVDGRSVMWRQPDGRVVQEDLAVGKRREWRDAGIEWIGQHLVDPAGGPGVTYVAFRKGINGDARTLMFWNGEGQPRELLRASTPDQFSLAGWLPGGRELLVVRWTHQPGAPDGTPRNETLWRVPVSGGPLVPTGLTMEGLRDLSIHPDGLRIAFNAGWKKGEQWVMENLLPQ